MLRPDGRLEFEVELFHEDISKKLEERERSFIDGQAGRGVYRKVMSGNGRQLSVNKKDIKNLKQQLADQVSAQIQDYRDDLQSLLKEAEEQDQVIDWEASRRAIRDEFSAPDPPEKPELENVPSTPSKRNYEPSLTLLDYLIPSRKQRKAENAVESFKRAKNGWNERRRKVWTENERRKEEYKKSLEEWEEKVRQIERTKERELERLEELRANYKSGESDSVAKVIRAILDQSEYPSDDLFSVRDLIYDPEGQRMVVDMWMPSPDDIPNRKEVKYVKTRDAYKPKQLSKKDFRDLYESVIYQGTLRTIYEVFSGDEESMVQSVVFNGYVESVNDATGLEETKCIVSLETSRNDIMKLNFSRLDPKACFQNLNGVSASSLEDVSPVTPMAQIDKSDARFTEGRTVGENMEQGQNIAAMDWEEFEHLIRELFEKEFAEGGGEVNVTQSSRDGGIDAVIFDPDPLRGGKIVVQAKRYTRTVGVSAVRDLYGTVMNEGANKGILVTTSGFGPDAYKFAKDKPIELLSGGNLLGLLEQHNYDARINIDEARKELQ